ncbi:MAG: bifunctional UDP-N-acetylglucosamine diphosphorylase/glucosamine-1-phosphate N-acetyltransferase GlmU [Proteobacteria bacterium]|jgi:bifunctional UDP-N-acetylglucosamine pyrophosphorylase/glucosamine-1-phosphate N-acetyltransferase|nr:bifunctional UDP-N-acetylglucosamine diphosphorylase/glucosamine-1-phosphate N-acetyltransferase GlmU [Pseudomonadota bacterium]
MTASLNVALLAAGEGKRMHSALPKVLHPLAGKALAAHVLATVRGLSPRAIAVVTGFGAEAVEQALEAPDLVFVRQDPPQGTGDAVRVALTALPADGVTLVGLGDVPLVSGDALGRLASLAAEGRLALLTARVREPFGLGRIVRRSDGAVARIVEERDAADAERAIGEINTGFLAAPTALLAKWVARLTPHNAQREYYLTDIVAMAAAEGAPVAAHTVDDEASVAGVNDRAQLAALERIVQRRGAHELMVAGTSIADPERIDVRGSLACGRDVSIDVGCVFEGEVRLADGTSVGPHCVLRDVAVGAGTRIEAFCHLDSATIGANCRIGPYARLRPATSLADDVHIGNFVEVKASTLGKGSKANHLAYLGDATVGARVNYGAGSITANYDGANKHRSTIGDDVHVGSNCVLIAPIEVGAGATIGGGSTVVNAVPAHHLTVARARQVVIDEWQRPKKGEPRSSTTTTKNERERST